MVPKRMLKPWANISVLPLAEVGGDVVLVDLALRVIGREDHDDIGPLGGVGYGE